MMRHRSDWIDHYRQRPEVSALIIGGGINGIGTFRELALQGLDVLLVERADFCSGASAASSHMVHGGIRYLENGEFRLVREAVRERNRLIENAPHAVRPLLTVIPIFKLTSGLLNAPLKFLRLLNRPAERGAAVIKLGLLLYDAFTRSQGTVPRHRFASHRESLAQYPRLNPEVRFTACYYDAAMPSPERICMDLIQDAVAANPNARPLNYTAAAGADGGLVQLQDRISGETWAVRPKVVVNAAGPWIDLANRTLGSPSRFIGGTKGSHLVIDSPALRMAIGENEFFFENDDGRIVLIYPLDDKVLVGTSDIPVADPDEVVCTPDEEAYFLQMIRKIFPGIRVEAENIVFRFSGVRPLPAGETRATGQISRDHHIRITEASKNCPYPILSLVGGKWTTFRAFSEQTAGRVLTRLGRRSAVSTAHIAIGGGRGYPATPEARRNWLKRTAEETGVREARLETLLARYGTRAADFAAWLSGQEDAPLAGAPAYSRCEIAWLAAGEFVSHLDDMLLRRTMLGMLGGLTMPLVVEIAGIAAEELGWGEERKGEEIERLLELLAARHQVFLRRGEACAATTRG